MSRAESYRDLAKLLEYPQDREALLQCLESVGGYLGDCGLGSPAASFTAFLRESPLARLQEEYVANFDFNPARAPYLGHHLYGDNQKKALYLIKVKQEFARFGFTPETNELPDHLSVLLCFLAHLSSRGEDEGRRQFIAQAVLPGLQKLTAAGRQDSQSPWQSLIETAELLMNADCKEVSR